MDIGDFRSWRRRVKNFFVGCVRQVPCLHAVVSNIRIWRRRRYQTLGEGEDQDGTEVEDKRQDINILIGQGLTKTAILLMVAITVLLLIRGSGEKDWDVETDEDGWSSTPPVDSKESFKRDSPFVLYLGAMEILVCGACCHTAGFMYKRRKHALQHPADSPEKEQQVYTKVHLQKEVGQEERQLYGLGFRPSSDGLECLIVEAVRPGSVLEQWTKHRPEPSPEQLLEAALGDDADGKADGECDITDAATGGVAADAMAPSAPAALPAPRETELPAGAGTGSSAESRREVFPGCAIVAVNDVSADVGMMQLQLTKSKVTLWLRSDFMHPSQLDSEIMASQPEGTVHPSLRPMGGPPLAPTNGATAPAATVLGASVTQTQEAPANDSQGAQAATQPRCACLAFEDEEPQILVRWLVCGLVFGWVTILPVLLMQPHEERPRQKVFRQHLLKPCAVIMPIWMLLWLLDCVEILFAVQLLHPFYYFGICHMVLPAALAWYLMRMQAADEKLVLDQRRSRSAEAACTVPVVIEDPAPMLLKELISVNPVVLMWLGACSSLALVVSNLLTPLETERGKMAQRYIMILYTPMIALQIAFGYILYNLSFLELPRFYIQGVVSLISAPCLLVFCCCLVCMSRHGQQDLALVEKQRLERALEAVKAQGSSFTGSQESGAAGAGTAPSPSNNNLVDCTDAQHREYELIYTA